MVQLKENQKKYEMELSNKRGQIDSLSAQMSALARHQKSLQSKSNDIMEAMSRISDCINQLKAV